jgi:3-isopropylmalate/(R)-2-methylmalate dehydratase large subunit
MPIRIFGVAKEIRMGQTIAEKIFSKKAGRTIVPGEIIEIEPDIAMSHDNTADISNTFYKIGVDKVARPEIHVIVLDHCSPAANQKYAENHKTVREFVRKQGIKNFFDVNRGICHQVLVEEGFILPGTVVVGSDSHTTHYGALGAFGAGIGRSEMAVVMATGKLWLRCPETIKITLSGKLQPGVMTKDLMLHIIGTVSADGALYKCVEFHGEALGRMSFDSRMVFSNMSVEMGAKAGIVPPDDLTIEFLKNRARRSYEVVLSDADAAYEQELSFDLDDLEPQVACPHTVDNVKPVSDVAGTKINMAFLGTCCNARIEDLHVAAEMIKGRKIAEGVRFQVTPASQQVYLEAVRDGTIETLITAGAYVTNSNCGPCLGAHMGIPAPGEVVISTANRNFKGRMGCKESEVYLASPATVTAAAITGEIVDCRKLWRL